MAFKNEINIFQVHEVLEAPPTIAIPPSSILFSSSIIKELRFTSSEEPNPLHSEQAPNGALKENNLGFISGNETSG